MYDPVCFAPGVRGADDRRIVRLDHEEILIRGRIVGVAEIGPSFREFIQVPAA